MAKRTGTFREEVLGLDDFRCQICGFDGHDEGSIGFLQVDHVMPRGMGGIPSRDDLANGMTLCARCHKLKTDGDMEIERWDRNDPVNGLIAHNMPVKRAWFYVKEDKAMLEQSISVLSDIALSAAKRAQIIAHVWENYHLLDFASPKQLVSDIGLDPNEAEREARVSSFFDKNLLIWPDGVNMAKATLVMRVFSDIPENEREEHLEEIQKVLNFAAIASYSDVKRRLIEGGYIEVKETAGKKRNFYIRLPKDVFFDNAVICLGEDGQILANDEGMISFRVGKFFRPLKKWGERLTIENGLTVDRIKVKEMEG